MARGRPEHRARRDSASAFRASARPSTITGRCASRTSSRSWSAWRPSASKSMRYACLITRGDTTIATGTTTIVCVTPTPTSRMKAVPVSRRRSSARFEVAVRAPSGRPRSHRAEERLDRDALAARRASGSPSCCAPSTAATPFYTRKLDAAGVDVERAGLPARPRAAAVHDQGRAGRRPAGHPPWGTNLTEPLDATRATARRRPPPAGPCAGWTPTRAGSGCSTAGRPCTARRTIGPGDRVFFPVLVRAVPGVLGRLRRGSRRWARTACPAAACRASCRLAPDRRRRRDGRLLHADLRAAPGGGRGSRRQAGALR